MEVNGGPYQRVLRYLGKKIRAEALMNRTSKNGQ